MLFLCFFLGKKPTAGQEVLHVRPRGCEERQWGLIQYVPPSVIPAG